MGATTFYDTDTFISDHSALDDLDRCSGCRCRRHTGDSVHALVLCVSTERRGHNASFHRRGTVSSRQIPFPCSLQGTNPDRYGALCSVPSSLWVLRVGEQNFRPKQSV